MFQQDFNMISKVVHVQLVKQSVQKIFLFDMALVYIFMPQKKHKYSTVQGDQLGRNIFRKRQTIHINQSTYEHVNLF